MGAHLDLRPRPRSRPWADVALVLVLATLTGLSAALVTDDSALPFALAWAPLLLLWWRHDLPVTVFLLVEAAAFSSRVVYGANGPTELLVLVAMYTVATRRSPRWSVATIVVDVLAMTAALTIGGESDAVGLETLGQLLAGVVAVLLGLYVQSRREAERTLEDRAAQLERDRERHAREAVEEERHHIARELHDVVAHHVSVMTLQAGALQKRLEVGGGDEELVRTATSIRHTGQEAMTELRRLLGVLGRDGVSREGAGDDRAPQPDLRALDGLVARMREAGMPVRLTVEGPVTEVRAAMALAVHRIVQEALTNTLRHAGPVPTEVRVAVTPAQVEVVVRDHGPSAAPPYPDGGGTGAGRGLVGMRERAALFDGTVTAGPHPDGGFEVRAELPRDLTPAS